MTKDKITKRISLRLRESGKKSLRPDDDITAAAESKHEENNSLNQPRDPPATSFEVEPILQALPVYSRGNVQPYFGLVVVCHWPPSPEFQKWYDETWLPDVLPSEHVLTKLTSMVTTTILPHLPSISIPPNICTLLSLLSSP